MKKIPTKADIRAKLERQTERFRQKGGEVQNIPSGVSGRENPLESIKTPLFTDSKTSRTPVPEVVAALDSRRKIKPEKKKVEKSQLKEQIIYDDFGEPLRKIWVDK